MGHSTFLTVLVGPIQFLVVATLTLGLFAYTRALIRAERRDRWVMIFLMVIALAWTWGVFHFLNMQERGRRELAQQRIRNEHSRRVEEIKRRCNESPALEMVRPVVADQDVIRFEYRHSWSDSWALDDNKGVSELTKEALFAGGPFRYALELVRMRADDPRCQHRDSTNELQCVQPEHVYKVWPKDGEDRLALLADFHPKYVFNIPQPSRYGDELLGQRITLREGDSVLAEATVYETGGMVCPERSLLVREMIRAVFLRGQVPVTNDASASATSPRPRS